ncbi:dihydrodipicolinate synthase family protein [Arthrobacter sp. VKM Ac-2550]|uniref:dihydrodipicolinate synthase family protein n=1 Tax=Crystallibacter permensis TaxID=1938888 RepID=UPI002225C7A0|nr:dihydrodipicolinate synthase family protein [Arthrobacter sp. VKM Ac-2550]MCW2135422.1 4-hydroxy-tetrahydrodipicolinate synthase [Arthrobacter sp. VKM Ac-2550]
MFDQLRSQLAGVVAIPVTPFDSDGNVDSDSYTKIISRMVEAGMEVITPNGNTSEFYSLTVQERQSCLELSVAAVGSAGTVLAGVGHSVPEAIEAATAAQQAGASAIMIHQPVHPYLSVEGWFDYHVAIANAVPQLGVVLYVRNPRIDGKTIARLADAAPNLIGVKYAVADPVRFATVLRDCDRDEIVWIAGLAELSAPGYWAVGATGFTSGFANVAPALSLQLLQSLRASDKGSAMKIWELIQPFEELRALNDSEKNVSVVKESLAQIGLCRRDVRPPISVLDTRDRQLVKDMIVGWQSAL